MVEVPTAKQLRQIPLRALVAYAVRCAQRVRPLYVLGTDVPEEAEYLVAIDSAISVAADFATGVDISKMRAMNAEEAAVKAVVAATQFPDADGSAAYAANAVYAVVHTTVAALDLLNSRNDKGEAATAVIIAAITTVDAAAAADKTVIRAAEFDWQMLHRMQLGHFPDAGDPVDPTAKGFLGPIYRDWQGEPKLPRLKSSQLNPPQLNPPQLNPPQLNPPQLNPFPSDSSPSNPLPSRTRSVSVQAPHQPSSPALSSVAVCEPQTAVEFQTNQETLFAQQQQLDVELSRLREEREALESEKRQATEQVMSLVEESLELARQREIVAAEREALRADRNALRGHIQQWLKTLSEQAVSV